MKKNLKIEKAPHILVLGELDITLKINFSEEDLEIKSDKENNHKKYHKLKNIYDISSLSFIHNNEEIIKHIKLSSKNELIKLLMIGNLNSENKAIIDYICFGAPIFSEKEAFFYDILDSVTKRYGIIFNKKPLNLNAGYYIKIELIFGSQKKEILIESEGKYEHEDDNDIKEEGDTQSNYNILEDDFDEDYPLNEAMQKGLIPKYRRRNILCNMYPLFDKYNMVFFNFEDLNKISKNFKYEYALELIDFFKKKKSIIFINYYKQEKEQKNSILNSKIQKKDKLIKKKPSKKIVIPEKQMIEITNRFYYVTDVYFFDKKQAIKLFNEHYKLFTLEKSNKIISSRNVYDYFIKGIATGTEEKVPNDKTGIFLDEFNELCFIQASKNSVYKYEYDPHPFPKINTHNIKEVSEYKDIIKQNKDDFYSIFLSEMVISISHCNRGISIGPSIVYPSYLTGVDLIKKKIEYIKNGIEIPENIEKFYKIKKHPELISQELEKFEIGEKEEKFLLDCTNKLTSNKKEYISLFDFHLKKFFSNENIRKNLENKGFIDSDGYVLYDPLYKDAMGTNPKKKKFTEKQMQDKIKSDINDIKIQTMNGEMNKINTNDINIFSNDNFNMTTERKIPFIKEKFETTNTNIKKKKISKKGFNSKDGFYTFMNYEDSKNILDEKRKTK